VNPAAAAAAAAAVPLCYLASVHVQAVRSGGLARSGPVIV